MKPDRSESRCSSVLFERRVGLYKLLRPGDLIAIGDEFLDDDCKTWNKATGIAIGMTYSRVMLPARRLLATNAALTDAEGKVMQRNDRYG